jgi:hypothetical protein
MVVLIGLCIAAGALYFWLLGDWFARVLMFLLLSAPLAMLGWAVMREPGSGGTVAWCVAAMAATWPLSGIPLYYREHRLEEAAAERARQEEAQQRLIQEDVKARRALMEACRAEAEERRLCEERLAHERRQEAAKLYADATMVRQQLAGLTKWTGPISASGPTAAGLR